MEMLIVIGWEDPLKVILETEFPCQVIPMVAIAVGRGWITVEVLMAAVMEVCTLQAIGMIMFPVDLMFVEVLTHRFILAKALEALATWEVEGQDHTTELLVVFRIQPSVSNWKMQFSPCLGILSSE